MKLIYNDPKIEGEVKKFVGNTGASLELTKDLKEMLEDAKKEHPDKEIGAPIPESFIDLGKYLFVFFMGAILNGTTWDLVKAGVKKLLLKSRSKTDKKYGHFLISNGKDESKFEENVYFYIPILVNEAELEVALDQIQRTMIKIQDLKQDVKIEGSLRFYYEDGVLVLRRLESASFLAA